MMATDKKNSKGKNFDEFLKYNLLFNDYMNLPIFLKETTRYTTMIKRNPAIGETHHLAVILKLINKINKEVDSKFLMNEFGFGSNTLTKEAQELIVS